jgi:hypothetical protein
MPTLVGFNSFVSTSSIATPTVSLTVVNHNALIVAFATLIQVSTSPSDRGISGCTIDETAAIELKNLRGSSTNRRFASGMYYRTGIAAGSVSAVFTLSANMNRHALFITEIAGFDPDNPVLQNAGAIVTSAGNAHSLSVTTALSDSFWLACGRAQGSDSQITPVDGVTRQDRIQSGATTDAAVAGLLTRPGEAGTYDIGSYENYNIPGGGTLLMEIANAPAPTGLKSWPYFYRQRQ